MRIRQTEKSLEKKYRTLAAVGVSVFMLATHQAQAQDCTGPNGAKGDVMFNSSFDAFQGCTERGWMAFHQPAPDPCTSSGTPGTACRDGQTVYAGSWNGSRYYTTTADQSTGAYWGTYGVTLGANAQSLTDGRTNTNTALASIEGNPQAGACNAAPYNPPACAPNAHLLCKSLRSTLGGDWYLPARDEIVSVLYANKAAIGGFSNVYYWSSTETNDNNARIVLLSGGTLSNTNKNFDSRVRCVRRE